MNPIKLLRKLGKALRGGAGFRDMFLGIFLGFAIGMIPGVNLTLIVLILLLLLLNANGALAALAIVASKALCLLLAPVTFRIGHTMIHDLGLAGVVRAAADTPVLALLDLHVYCLIGAIPVIVIVGIPLGWFVPRSVLKMRARIAAATESSDRLQKASQNRFTKIVMRVVFGKQKETFAEMADKKTPLIRKGRVIAALVLIAVIVILQFAFLDTIVRRGLEMAIASANGAEVNIDEADLSLASGRLVIEGLQVTDAARPERNQVQVERIVADVSIADLLARRFVVDLVEVQAMRTDVERSSPGEVYRPKEKEKEPSAGLGDLLGKLGKSAEYYEEVKRFNERLQKVRDYLESEDPDAAEPDKQDLAERAKAMGYLRLSAKDYLTRRPTWVIREIRVSQIELRPDLPTFTAEGKDLSSHPSLHPEKMELSARPDEDALKAFLAAHVGGEKMGGLLGGLLGGKKEGDKKKGLLDGLLGK